MLWFQRLTWKRCIIALIGCFLRHVPTMIRFDDEIVHLAMHYTSQILLSIL